jgi:hypothetical protein
MEAGDLKLEANLGKYSTENPYQKQNKSAGGREAGRSNSRGRALA